MATVGEGAEPQRSDITKAGLAALVASSIEWYDFFIYLTAAALVFPAVFFPESSAVAGVLASFSTAAVGFVARPVGGVLFGHFGDKLGRKPTLVIALVLMGTATVLVGLLPGFATIGVWAPILLFVFRFCQGLAIGGQWGGAVLLATEYAPPNRRGLFGSLAQTGVPVGVIFGNLIFLAVGAGYSLGSKRRPRSGTWRSSRRVTRPRNARQCSRSSRSIPSRYCWREVLSSSSMGHSTSSSAAFWTMVPGAWDCLATRC